MHSALVKVYTTRGVLSIGLFAKETPEACRAFLQNCLNGTFAGAPLVPLEHLLDVATATNTLIKAERHSRLKPGRGMVSLGKEGHQVTPDKFHISLDGTETRAPLGCLVGDSIYTVTNIVGAEFAVHIERIEVEEAFFGDLRATVAEEPKKRKVQVGLAADSDFVLRPRAKRQRAGDKGVETELSGRNESQDKDRGSSDPEGLLNAEQAAEPQTSHESESPPKPDEADPTTDSIHTTDSNPTTNSNPTNLDPMTLAEMERRDPLLDIQNDTVTFAELLKHPLRISH